MNPTLLALIVKLCSDKKTNWIAVGFLLVMLVWGAGSIWAKFANQPATVAQHETRLTALEFDKATQSEQLRTINYSLNRIETSVGETRRDVSELKTTLIRK